MSTVPNNSWNLGFPSRLKRQQYNKNHMRMVLYKDISAHPRSKNIKQCLCESSSLEISPQLQPKYPSKTQVSHIYTRINGGKHAPTLLEVN